MEHENDRIESPTYITLPETPVALWPPKNLRDITGLKNSFIPPQSFFQHLSYPTSNDDYVIANIGINTTLSWDGNDSSNTRNIQTEIRSRRFTTMREVSPGPKRRLSQPGLSQSPESVENVNNFKRLSNLTLSSAYVSKSLNQNTLILSSLHKGLQTSADSLSNARSNLTSQPLENPSPLQKEPFHAFLKSGYRTNLFFDPKDTNVAIVTTGGLCPGVNTIVRSITLASLNLYQVSAVYGVRGGFYGFSEEFIHLTPEKVRGITLEGGTILGTDRGGFDAEKVMDRLVEERISVLFVIGGDGTHRAAYKLYKAVLEKKLPIAIVGLPKSIDNDIGLIDHTFGFPTAVEKARDAVRSIQVEAQSQPNCVGLVKIMGRDAGFLASAVAMASGDVDLCLLPEIEIDLEKLKRDVRVTIEKRKRCVIVFSEGCKIRKENSGAEEAKTDRGGNKILPAIEKDIISSIKEGLEGIRFSIKFNEPKYMIRSCEANALDANYCVYISQNAVHGAMAGFTGFSSVVVNTRKVMVPLELIVKASPAQVNIRGKEVETLKNCMNEDAIV